MTSSTPSTPSAPMLPTRHKVFLAGTLATAVVACVLWVVNCTGPRPEVVDVRLVEPKTEAEPYRVEATVRNTWRGHGSAEIFIRLRDTTSGRVIEKTEQATLDGGETLLVVAEVWAPRAQYAVEARAHAPPH